MASSKEGTTTDAGRTVSSKPSSEQGVWKGCLIDAYVAAAARATAAGDEPILEGATPEERAVAEEHMAGTQADPSERDVDTGGRG